VKEILIVRVILRRRMISFLYLRLKGKNIGGIHL